ncbi:hypothetical protein KC19_8G044600 [Ceratodon purpureus]|uniref:Protein kinase domain-containing protein n=1 Tax=Ceratodon purpureus TaxID=3225 RepID=A0A8T0GXH3_CERPU|nr:hypothetical protein KC19_8G044600 [Ceratodon purpureus]
MVCLTELGVFIPHDHLYSFKTLPLQSWRWCRIELILLSLYFIAVFPVATLLVQSAGLSTNFSYTVFPSADDFLTSGESQYDPRNFSFNVNPEASVFFPRLECVKLFYKDLVRMKSGESNAMASFSTSFTFSITQGQFTNRSGWLGHAYGLMFIFGSEDFLLGANAGKYFGVEFDTYNNFITEDPSDSHIGVALNNLNSAYTYNLCEGQRTSCSFPWTGRTYTAWIEYYGPTRSLEVWFANGSLRGVVKPAVPALIRVDNLDVMDIFEDYMYVAFSGNVWPTLDTHQLLSWNFASSLSEAVQTPMQRRLFSKSWILIVCAAFGSAILAAIYLLGHWKTSPNKSYEFELEHLMGVRRFTFKELKKATNNFNEGSLLGKGGSGTVYKGTLTPSGVMVAVKRLKHDSQHVDRVFLAEVSSISQIRHRNLVHLQGWCHEDAHFLLVFDHMSNGSLDEWLFPSRRRCPSDPKYKKFEVLPWELRFSILAGVAAAVEYLHEEWVQCVLHRDIKLSNVMLDADFNPHLGDFGLARLMDHKKLEKTTMVAGTFGCMAPEIHYTGRATKESDVYSFGVLMLEVLCGRRAVNLQVEDPDEDFMLLQAVWRSYEGGNILSAVDPGLLRMHPQQRIPSTGATNQTSRVTEAACQRDEVHEFGPTTGPTVSRGATANFGEEVKVVHLLHLGLRVVKQVIMQVQGSTADKDSISTLKWLPALPSIMPSLGLHLSPSSEEVETRLFPENSRYHGVHRRFVTN